MWCCWIFRVRELGNQFGGIAPEWPGETCELVTRKSVHQIDLCGTHPGWDVRLTHKSAVKLTSRPQSCCAFSNAVY
jgi:hypothetical protein